MNRIILALMAAGIFLACQDAPTPDELTAPLFTKYAPDITVDPSGDVSGTTDANAIEAALNAAAPGEIIGLAEGTFYIGRTLVAPVGFNGSLRGAGQDETTIMGVGTVSTPFGNAPINFPGGPFLVERSSFFFFPQPSGYLAVSDLATSLPGTFVTEVGAFDWGTDLVGFFTVQLGDDDCNTLFENLRLEGTEPSTTNPWPFLVHQPRWGIEVLGVGDAFPFFSSGGHHVVRNSEFSKVGIDATIHELLKDASIEITNNTFTDVKQVITAFLDGASVSITKNTLNTFSFGAIVVTQQGVDIPGNRSNVVIRGNNISTDGFTGIEIGNLGSQQEEPDFNLLIEGNKIHKGDDPIGLFSNLSGIQIATGEEGAMVRNNIIRGEGIFGILTVETNNSAFIGNNLQGFTPLDADFALFGSNENTIVGVGNGTVLDLGLGNIITGLTKVQGDESIGERIKAAQERRREIREAIGGGYWP
jgi:hypothetical protein